MNHVSVWIPKLDYVCEIKFLKKLKVSFVSSNMKFSFIFLKVMNSHILFQDGNLTNFY